jgi:hypothetical protein
MHHHFSCLLCKEKFPDTQHNFIVGIVFGSVILLLVVVLFTLQFASLFGCFSLFFFGLLLFLHKGKVDDCEHQVKQKERSNENKGHEVQEDSVGVRLLVHHLDVTPAFKGNALKHDK